MISPFARLEAIGRPLLERYLTTLYPQGSEIIWVDRSGAEAHAALWRFLCDGQRAGATFALPQLERRDVLGMAEAIEEGGELLEGIRVKVLPDDAPVPSLRIESSFAAEETASTGVSDQVVNARTRAWVRRTLSPEGLRFCPYTSSETTSGGGLEELDVAEAPIYYAVSSAQDLRGLMRDFWSAVMNMLSSGEEGVSSIVLSAPNWDDRWQDWYKVVFLVLESSLLASGLSRTFGVVCFHPFYSTPPVRWLARHRFGHMHSTQRLRDWLEEEDPDLSDDVEDEELEWAGSMQRRSPHAMINVLWTRQLEVAENVRESSSLYTRNIGRALEEGKEELDRIAAKERTAST